MHIAVVGAGPTGLYAALALARRGHAVTVVDRDAGPAPDGSWARAGVMQFHHPHGFRPQVGEALAAELPDVLDALVAAGAEPIVPPGSRGGGLGLRCRRLTFERVLRAAAVAAPGVTFRRGHADAVLAERGRAAGLRVDGARLDADLVLVAGGRAGRLGRDLRAPAEGGDCGLAYVSRQYRLHTGAEPGSTDPVAAAAYPGYLTIVFPHDAGVFSVLLVRSATDTALARLRDESAFEAATAAIPLLAERTDPARAHPFTPVLPGGRLRNAYQGQLDAAGAVPLPGLVFVGDAVCSTTPTAGRGVAMALMQARALIGLLDGCRYLATDIADVTRAFDAWCTEWIRPWFDDHLASDTGLVRRWDGEEIDPESLPSDLLCAAAEADPSLRAVVGPYQAMRALPASLAAIAPRAREMYAGGWRPAVPGGPTRDELAALVARHAGALAA